VKKIIAKISILLSLISLLGLGLWQLKRMEYKNNLIKDLEEKLSLPTEMISNIEILTKAYTKVRICGHYLDAHELFVYNKPNYIILAPFHIENINQSIIVARGNLKAGQEYFTPDDSHACITGILVPSEKKPLFMPESTGAKNKPLLSINIESITNILSLELPDMYLLLIPNNEDNIKSGLQPINIPNPKGIYNPHLGYAITWFALAIILGFMVILQTILKKPKI